MIPSDNNKRLFLDMQEHPEKYSDEQLEAMMDDLDSDLDTHAAWQRFEQTSDLAAKPSRRWLRIAAIFAGVLFLAGIAVAAWMASPSSTPSSAVGDTIVPINHDAPSGAVGETTVSFDNVPLDSILTVVSVHYGKVVSFRSGDLHDMKFIITWQPDTPLADFLDRLNAFDGLSFRLLGDTIVVEEEKTEEE